MPFFAGFYSKDSIIEAVHFSHLPGSGFAYFAVVAGVFVTAFYCFRMYFLVFHGQERFRHKPFPGEHDHPDEHGHVHVHEPHESPAVVTVPLVLLAIASVVIGYLTIQPMLYGDFFKDSIVVLPVHPAMAEMAREFRGAWGMAMHAVSTLPFWLMVAGVAAWPGAVHPEARRAGGDPRALRLRLPRARQQVLLRLVQRERARAAGARHGPGACGRAATRR